MKKAFFVAAIAVLLLVACGEPKPGQYPPSQNILDERENGSSETQ
ncbi:hypothetical protein SAMN05216302_1001167 [Nitrosomonas aestuarii]|uniref:Lipoprotein-attachment site-containing protein n=1 Tax=Nitrosomonas aestuarii TaxID=52441 RepID=A0A1I3X869_9PROT|nr:hypothetical protein [Nitrosomonas aestuarii]SFK15798.1 hypothetical protein SAMN05216302_1001167 [Nitrosomonas aestuarii]